MFGRLEPLGKLKLPVRKIGIVIPKYTTIGGGEKFAFELSERIARDQRYEVHVFANKWEVFSDRIAFHRVPLISFPRFLKPISFAYLAERRMAREHLDLVHSHERIFNADLYTVHSIPHRIWVRDVRKRRLGLYDYAVEFAEKRMIRDAKRRRFLGVSNLTKEKYCGQYKLNCLGFDVLNPGVDLERFTRFHRSECRADIRRRFNIRSSDIVVLFVGMNFEIKGLGKLLAAVAFTKKKYSAAGLKLLVIGKGNYKKYMRLAKELGIRDDIIFAGIWKQDIEQVYLASDIYAMLSEFDTFGMVVLEAMAASLPVIISRNVGAKDIVASGGNGYIVEADNVESVSSKLARMLSEDQRTQMGRKAQETALEHTWDKVTEKVRETYEELTKEFPVN